MTAYDRIPLRLIIANHTGLNLAREAEVQHERPTVESQPSACVLKVLSDLAYSHSAIDSGSSEGKLGKRWWCECRVRAGWEPYIIAP